MRSGGEIDADIEFKSSVKFDIKKYSDSIQQALSNIVSNDEFVECYEIVKNGIIYRHGDGLFVSREGQNLYTTLR